MKTKIKHRETVLYKEHAEQCFWKEEINRQDINGKKSMHESKQNSPRKLDVPVMDANIYEFLTSRNY